jgi:molybdopterin/thiamine biosynthesis adenylyltransferase/rhodanese-related sulfurtransferase
MRGIRYNRQEILTGWGKDLQQKLENSIVLIVGVGGLGSHAASALCAAGVGTLILLDSDLVQIENLHRQYFYTEMDLGHYKTLAIKQRLMALNSACTVISLPEKWTKSTLIPGNLIPDLVLDGTDSFESKYEINEYCQEKGIPWVYASVLGFKAELSVFHPSNGVCYKCLYPTLSAEFDSCERTGVAGPLPAIVGTKQAWEAIALLSGTLPTLAGQLWQINLSQGREKVLNLERNPDCKLKCTVPCPNSIRSLVPGEIDFEAFLNDFRLNPSLWKIIDIRAEGLDSMVLVGIEKMDAIDLLSAGLDYSKAQKILVVCEKGRKSQIVQEKLQQQLSEGMVFSLKGGFYSGFQSSSYLESL